MAPFLRSRSKHRSGRRSRTKYDLIKHPHRVGFPKSEPHRARDSPSTRSPNPCPPASFISPELFPDQPPGASPIACFTSPELYPDQPRCIIDPPASSRRNSSQIYPVHPVPVVLLSSKPRHCPLLRSRNSGDKLRDLNRATLPCSARGIGGHKLRDLNRATLPCSARGISRDKLHDDCKNPEKKGGD